MANVGLMDQQAQSRGQRIASGTNPYGGAVSEVESFATKLQEGSPIPAMKTEGENKMRELFAFDQKLDGEFDPLKAQRQEMYPGAVQHPGAITSAASGAITGGAAGVKDLFGAIGKYKSLEGQQLNSALSTIFSFVKTEQQRKKDEADRAWEEKKFNLQEQRLWASQNASKDTGRSVQDILGMGADFGAGAQQPVDRTKTPQYTPAKAGTVETGADGRQYISDAQGSWKAIGEPTTQPTGGIDRNQIIEALTRTTDKNEQKRLLDILDVLPSSGVDDTTVKRANELRDEYNNLSKDYVDVRDAYNRILSATDSAAGDVSLVFGYMKILDPGSVVREGEFATAENTAGIPDRIWKSYNKALKGDRLSADQRTNFKTESKNLYNSATRQHEQLVGVYTGIANKIGVDPSLVVVDQSLATITDQLKPGEIMVRRKSDGQTGAIPENEFNSGLYERI